MNRVNPFKMYLHILLEVGTSTYIHEGGWEGGNGHRCAHTIFVKLCCCKTASSQISEQFLPQTLFSFLTQTFGKITEEDLSGQSGAHFING